MTTIQERATPLLALVDASTAGPWHLSRCGPSVYTGSQRICDVLEGETEHACADAYAISKLHDLAALLREAVTEMNAAKPVASGVDEPVAWRSKHEANHDWCLTAHNPTATMRGLEGAVVQPLYVKPMRQRAAAGVASPKARAPVAGRRK